MKPSNNFFLSFVLFALLGHLFNDVTGQDDIDYNINDYDTNNITYENETGSQDNYEEAEECSDEAMLERLKEIFLPEDWEEYNDSNVAPADLQSLEAAVIRMDEYRKNVTRKLEPITKVLANDLKDKILSLDITNDCMATLFRIMAALGEGETWALKFIDSQPLNVLNLFTMSGIPLGDYDQCLLIKSPEEEGKFTIRGKYCGLKTESYFEYENEKSIGIRNKTLKYKNDALKEKFSWAKKDEHYNFTSEDLKMFFENLPFNKFQRLLNIPGFCLPTTCNSEDMSLFVNSVLSEYIDTPINFKDDCDYEAKEVKLKPFQKASIAIISIFALLVMLFSICDNYYAEESRKWGSWYHLLIYCFSVNKTAEAIFSVRHGEKYKCLDALKIFIPFYIILGNTFVYNINGKNMRQPGSSAPNEIFWGYRRMLYSNHLIMDNCILVAAIILFIKFDKLMLLTKGKLNYIKFVVYRYIRVLPLIFTCILFALIYEHIGDGPFWSIPSTYFTDSCKSTWNMPLTMMNNLLYYLPEYSDTLSTYFNNCMPNSWILTTEFHLFILSPIIMIPLFKRPRLGIVLLVSMLALTLPIPLLVRLFNKTPALFEIFVLPEVFRSNESTTLYLTAPWNFVPGYLCGIAVAYMIKKKPKIYLGDQVGEMVITIITLSMTIGVIVWRKDLNQNTYKFDAFFGYEKEVFLLVEKFFYLSGFCWVIFACVTGRLEIINEVMGSEPIRVMSNMALEMYMFNTFFVLYRVGVAREFVTFSDFNLWNYAVVDFIFVYLFSAFASMLMIKPMTRLMVGAWNHYFPEQGNGKPKLYNFHKKSHKEVADTDEPGVALKVYTVDINKNDVNQDEKKYANDHDANNKNYNEKL